MRAHRTRAVAVMALVAASLPLAPASAAGPPACRGVPATVVGTSGPDTLEGTAKADVIVGLGGDDVVRGRGGDDLLCGGGGSDRLFGDAGADRLFGGADRLREDSAGSYLVGDVLDGGPGDDELAGGPDDRRAEAHRLPDTFSYAESPGGVVVDLSERPGVATGQGTDLLRFGPHVGVRGSLRADTITGSDGADQVHGLAGDDVIGGGPGDDTLYAEELGADSGDDLVRGGRGADLLGSYTGRDDLGGGAGDDFVEAYSDRPTRVSGDRGDDYVAQNLTAGSGAASLGGEGNDVLALYGALLEGVSPRTVFTIDLRDGTTTAGTDPVATGTVGGFEGHRLVGDLRWVFHGRPVADRVWAITGGPLRARTHGGNDWMHGTPYDDLLDGGSGTDAAVRDGGSDTCRSVEKGC